jgi:UDP-N-acetylmuramate dehydrogenase
MPSRDEFGTAGSFFKNPIVDHDTLQWILAKDRLIKYFPYWEKYKLAAWYILEKLWFKWKMYPQESGWEVWCYRNQALILVNKNASWKEIDAFATMLENAVYQEYGVKLERECITVK